MTSLFAESHNMVAILEKSEDAAGFKQIINFLSGSYIQHALTVNPHVYISCIKQFWNTTVVKRSSDVTSSAKASALICLSTEEVVDDVAQPTSPLPPSPVIPSTPPHQSPSPPQPQAEEGLSQLVQQVLDKCSALVLRVKGLETANVAQQLEILKLKARVKKLERLNKVKSSKLKRLKKVGTSQRVESSEDVENVFNQGRINVDEGIKLEVDQEKDAEDDIEVQEVVTTAKLITEVVTAAATQVAAVSAPITDAKPAAKPKVLKIVDAAPAVSTRKRKGVVIRDPEEELHKDTPAETPSVKDKGKGILIKDPKLMKKKDQIEMDAEDAKKLQEELEKEHEEAYKQIDWNAAFDHVQAKETQFDANMKFLFKTREEMEKEDEEIIKSIIETPAQKALLELMLLKRSKENTKYVSAASEELTGAKHKLMLLIYCC
nr:hypothetical protein [Tanacetum cinerariifolium]